MLLQQGPQSCINIYMYALLYGAMGAVVRNIGTCEAYGM